MKKYYFENTLQENVLFVTKIQGRILLLSLKVTFIDEILNVVNNANFLQTFPNKFEIFIIERCGGKIWRFFFGANTFVTKINYFPTKIFITNYNFW